MTSVWFLVTLAPFTDPGVAQEAGSVDQTFAVSSGANGVIRAVAQTPENKTYVGGGFTLLRGGARNRIARLDSEGGCDPSFYPGSGANGEVRAIALQVDGKIVIGGDFTQYNGIARKYLARVNPDGTLDTEFIPATINNPIHALHLLPDGRLMIGGEFTTINSYPYPRIARLLSDGRYDPTFVSTSGPNATVRTISSDASGRILIGGSFSTYRGASRNGVARINSNGTLDTTFSPGTGVDGPIYSLIVRSSDGKIYAGGNFTTFGGMNRSSVVRINSNGSLDESFAPAEGRYGDVNAILPQPNNSIIIAGQFYDPYNSDSQGIARLNDSGEIDFQFRSLVYDIRALAQGNDGTIVVAGNFDNNERGISKIVRLTSTGIYDTNFLSRDGLGFSAHIEEIVTSPNGSIFIGGVFYSYGNTSRRAIAKLDQDGRLDPYFRAVSHAGQVMAISEQPDGKILVAGQFNEFDGVFYSPGIVRLSPSGSVDKSFVSRGEFSSTIYDVIPTDGGKFYIVGGFSSYNGLQRRGVARINSDGSVDEGFDPGNGETYYTTPIFALPDGKLLVREIADFTGRGRVVRLNLDGSVDDTFVSGSGSDGAFYSLAVQGDGKILIGGTFGNYNGAVANKIARLHSDGTVDSTFSGSVGVDNDLHTSDGAVAAILPQADGRIWIAGDFSRVDGVECTDIARLTVEGALDSIPALGGHGGPYYDSVVKLAIQGDGRLLVGGSFSSFNGTERCNLVRIFTKSAQQLSFSLESGYLASDQLQISAMAGASSAEVSYHVVSGPAVIKNGAHLYFTGPGVVTVRASQPGDDDYFDAVPVEVSFSVVPPVVDVALGKTSFANVGRNVYSPERQVLSLMESRKTTTRAEISIGNRAILPSGRSLMGMAVRGGRGNRTISVDYFDRGIRVTAAIVLGQFETQPLDGSTVDQSLVVKARAQRSKHSDKGRSRRNATLPLPISASALSASQFSDSAVILIRFRGFL